MMLPDGYSEVAPGKIASVVTYLSMAVPPSRRAERPDAPWTLKHVARPDPRWYRELFQRVGERWLWYSRLAMGLEELEAVIRHPQIDIYSLCVDDRDEGLLELDFRHDARCELAFFGLTSPLLGRGAGRWLMNRAITYAWARPISCFWVHTCTLDHPGALAFYLRSGFGVYAQRVEVADDPRLSGLAPRTAAAHIPIIEPTR